MQTSRKSNTFLVVKLNLHLEVPDFTKFFRGKQIEITESTSVIMTTSLLVSPPVVTWPETAFDVCVIPVLSDDTPEPTTPHPHEAPPGGYHPDL